MYKFSGFRANKVNVLEEAGRVSLRVNFLIRLWVLWLLLEVCLLNYSILLVRHQFLFWVSLNNIRNILFTKIYLRRKL
jgi:hypothetical protein